MDYKMTPDERNRMALEHGQRMQALEDVVLAEAMFNAYNEHGPNPWQTFDGRDVPRWDAINDAVRAKWTASAKKARELLGGGR